MAAMLLDTADADTHRNGCRELMNLFSGDVMANMQAIVDAGGVAAVVVAMGQHTEDVEVQRYGSYALRNMTVGGDACMQAVVDGGGVAVVAAAMGQHPTDAILQICGSSALRSVAINAACAQAVVEGGGVSALVAAMRWNPNIAGCAASALQKLASSTNTTAVHVLEEVARTETDCSSWDGLREVLRECALARLQTALEGADVAALKHAITQAAAVQVDAREMHADTERQVRLESFGLGSVEPPDEFVCPITLHKMRGAALAALSPHSRKPPHYHLFLCASQTL